MKKSLRSITIFLLAASLLASCGPAASTPGESFGESGTTEASTNASSNGSTIAPTDEESDPVTTPETDASTNSTGADIPAEPAAPTLPNDVIDVTAAWGIQSGAGQALSNSLALMNGMSAMPDGSTIYFPEGTYEVAFSMFLIGKRDIRIVGHKATLVRTGTVNTTATQPPLEIDALPAEHVPLTSMTSFLYTSQSAGVTVEGLTFGYDTPTSLSGKVLSVSGGTVEIEITDGSPVTGGEYATVINSYTAEGVPDRVLDHYAATSFAVEKINDKTIRVSGIDPGGASNLKKGTRVCLRLCTGRDYIIMAQGASDLYFKNLTFHNSYNGGILLTDRCENATLDTVVVQSDNPEALMSLNADILHIAGLGGHLTVDNCYFERPGDDCVNVHNMACLVDATAENTATLTSPRFAFSASWASVGDTVTFYDAATFNILGTAKITAIDGATLTFDVLPAAVGKGSVVANSFANPTVELRNTTVKNTRARGFLLQTAGKTLVENCRFEDTALAAILVAPDLDNWFEMSSVTDLTIRNNDFDSCGSVAAGVIQISASHDSASKIYPAYIHQNISILGNRFSALRTPAVHALCTSALTIAGNEMQTDGYKKALASIRHCQSVILSSGLADKSELDDVTDLTEID